LIGGVAFCEAQKAYWDYVTKGLCTKDGGIKVYETVPIARDRLDAWGSFRIPYAQIKKPWDDYFSDSDTVYVKTGYPEVIRMHFAILRNQDHKILGEAVAYARRGGDFPSPAHDSSFLCPLNADLELGKRIFKPSD